MSKRLQIMLPDPVGAQLQQLAAGAGEPLATLARQMVRDGVALAAKSGKVRAPRASPTVGGKAAGRPRWLEPYGGDPTWRQEMWGAIVALRGRYPEHLEALNNKWWTDESTVETLSALAVWQAELDETRQDPPGGARVPNPAQRPRPTPTPKGGSVTKAWKPSATPPEWAGK